jgi:hypothetical protein
MAKTAKNTTIDVTVTKSGQAAYFTELLTPFEHRLRVSIKSDTYAEQSDARIERFDGSRWHEVWTIQPGAMKTPSSLVYSQTLSAGDFKDDRDLLVERAITILL